jgi:hypothetical protein
VTRSRRETAEQPGRADDVGAAAPDPFSEPAIGRDQHDVRVALGGERGEGVVSEAGCVDDRDTLVVGLFDAASGVALQDHDDTIGQRSVGDRASNPVREVARGAGTVTPPAGRPGSDDVRGVDEEHRLRFARIPAS